MSRRASPARRIQCTVRRARQFYDFTTQAEDLDAGKSYLELSNREIAMVDRVCKEFKNVIVVVNSSNAMELGWLDQYDSIKAAVLCGAPASLALIPSERS